jgi:hypothetical protein
MADYLRDQLGKVLDHYDEQRRTVLAREQKVRDEDAQFLAQFAELRRAVVRPAFETAAALLAERGHKVSIAEQEFSVGAGGKVAEAAISLHVVLSGARAPARDEQARTLSISTRHYNKTVAIDTGKPMEGVKGTYALEKLGRQLVEEELIKFIGGLVGA